MDVFSLDYLQDAEFRGHHLEREVEVNKFHPKDRAVIELLGRLSFGAPKGFKVVAAIAVRNIIKDTAWYIDGENIELTAGMLALGDNHVCIWLTDEEHSARYQIGHFMHSSLRLLCTTKDEDGETLAF